MSVTAPKFQRTKAVTLPTFSHKKVENYYFKVLGKIHLGKPIVKLDADGKPKEEPPAALMHVLNLETGEEGEYMVPKMVEAKFNEMDDDYLGKSYEIAFVQQREGRRYKEYAVYEIDPTQKLK
jgi:hypothetical protein